MDIITAVARLHEYEAMKDKLEKIYDIKSIDEMIEILTNRKEEFKEAMNQLKEKYDPETLMKLINNEKEEKNPEPKNEACDDEQKTVEEYALKIYDFVVAHMDNDRIYDGIDEYLRSEGIYLDDEFASYSKLAPRECLNVELGLEENILYLDCFDVHHEMIVFDETFCGSSFDDVLAVMQDICDMSIVADYIFKLRESVPKNVFSRVADSLDIYFKAYFMMMDKNDAVYAKVKDRFAIFKNENNEDVLSFPVSLTVDQLSSVANAYMNLDSCKPKNPNQGSGHKVIVRIVRRGEV